MHGLQRTHQCPCAPTQIQVALARFPTSAVPEPPEVLAGSVRLAAQPLAGWAQQEPVEVSGPPAALALPELLALQAASARLVPVVQVPPVLGELVAQLVPPVPRALWVRLAVLELLVPWAQVLLEHLAGWVRSVQQERLVPLVAGELVA